MSGDVTESEDAVEYIDARVDEARSRNAMVLLCNSIYCGAENWDDIDTAFCGCSVVGDDECDVRLFDPKNVVFRYDLTGEGSREVTSLVDLERGFVRVHRDECMELAFATFMLDSYIDLLLEACGAQRVSERKQADEALHVAPCEDGSWSLLGERFFAGAEK